MISDDPAACREPGPCLVTVEGLTKRFGARVAVDAVSFRVHQGEVLGLLGPNGAGKTTTMSMLSTLVAPDAGRIELCGIDPHAGAREARRLIGYVPQELALYPTLSARDNLAFFGRIYGLGGHLLKERIAEALEVVGLADRAGEAVGHFSGGMKRRLNIAASLLHRPQVIILDEPTVGVDPQSRNFILEHVERLKCDGMTLIYTTHYMEEAARLCDRVAVMDAGRILALDTIQALVRMLGGGILVLGVDEENGLVAAISKLEAVRQAEYIDGRIKVTVHDTQQALAGIVGLCGKKACTIRSLQVLEPNLEGVFLHLTGKRLRD